MNTLILKLNATGDVVRTTTLLRRLEGNVTWVTANSNVELLDGLGENLRCLSWDAREQARDRGYDLLINLEDEQTTAEFAGSIDHQRLYGAYLDEQGSMRYTEDARAWFDLSLISTFGRARADARKLENRASYQALLFSGLGWEFAGERYVLPTPVPTGLRGDVAIAPVAGAVWPMKAWAHYEALQAALESRGLKVNVLPQRPTLLEHYGDVSGHRCLVSGDSLPMHLALACDVSCVTIFNCTSPWEIYDYGLQTQHVSPLLAEHFYSREFDPRAPTAISLHDVLASVEQRLA